MKYRQLTEGTRYQIALLPGEKISLTESSKRAGTTVFREVRRNCKNAGEAIIAFISILSRYKDVCPPNVREGSEHRAVAEMYPDCPVCIACTQVNVNTNGLLRQLARKEPPCRQGLEMTRSTTWLRPCKCHGFRQPSVVFAELTMAA